MALEFLKEYESLVNSGIKKNIDILKNSDESDTVIVEGMEYALMAGGKRIRPIFSLLGAEIAGLEAETILDFAVAIEFIHTYSLVHDDLPGMDDDNLRRGKPTCHIKYGEGEAILIGDALLTHGFELMLKPMAGIGIHSQLRAVRTMVDSIGVTGMIGGQAADIKLERTGTESYASLGYIHRHKTGRLLEASLISGAILGDLPMHDLKKLGSYGESFGLAFQITDDILDLTSSPEELGKPIGSDLKNKKLTYPSIYGLEKSMDMARFEVENCIRQVDGLGKAGSYLAELAIYLMKRRK